MRCPNCQSNESKVTDSRDDERTIRRRRECLSCQHRFTTYEKIDLPRFLVIKRNRHIESYDRQKLAKGVKLAFEKRPFTDEQLDSFVDDIEQDLISLGQKEIKSQQIGDFVIKKLKIIDEVAYLRFISVYKSFSSAKRFISEADKLVGGKSKE